MWHVDLQVAAARAQGLLQEQRRGLRWEVRVDETMPGRAQLYVICIRNDEFCI